MTKILSQTDGGTECEYPFSVSQEGFGFTWTSSGFCAVAFASNAHPVTNILGILRAFIENHQIEIWLGFLVDAVNI